MKDLTVFVCVDDKGGTAFNNRRQSRDSEVVKRVSEISKNGRLLIKKYSESLFKGYSYTVDEDYLDNAGDRDYCFVETDGLAPYGMNISKLILFKWNRVYPSDSELDLDVSEYRLEEVYEFEGSSHDVITCEVWVK